MPSEQQVVPISINPPATHSPRFSKGWYTIGTANTFTMMKQELENA
jgi:hypothetical protein